MLSLRFLSFSRPRVYTINLPPTHDRLLIPANISFFYTNPDLNLSIHLSAHSLIMYILVKFSPIQVNMRSIVYFVRLLAPCESESFLNIKANILRISERVLKWHRPLEQKNGNQVCDRGLFGLRE